MIIEAKDDNKMKRIGYSIGAKLVGGETIELIGDIGAGKTTLTKGIATGMGVDDVVQSPSFTISRFYGGKNGLCLYHYDFYRLKEPGIMKNELEESLNDERAINIIEWSDSVTNILPDNRMIIKIKVNNDNSRLLELINFSDDIKVGLKTL